MGQYILREYIRYILREYIKDLRGKIFIFGWAS